MDRFNRKLHGAPRVKYRLVIAYENQVLPVIELHGAPRIKHLLVIGYQFCSVVGYRY